jgi:hypothetical protein
MSNAVYVKIPCLRAHETDTPNPILYLVEHEANPALPDWVKANRFLHGFYRPRPGRVVRKKSRPK